MRSVRSRSRLPAGLLLSGDGLIRVLDEGDRVFRVGSWARTQIRPAGYDLRLASDLMVVPQPGPTGPFRAYDRGEGPVSIVTLAPGESALVSTWERFSFDLDIAGLVSPKFRWAAQGLLILTGLAVDPGYGRERDTKHGIWRPADDQRLHFIVANVGPDAIMLRPGDPIAHLHLFTAESAPERTPIRSQGFDYLRSQLFGLQTPASSGLAYFRNVKDLQEQIATREAARDVELADLRAKIAETQNLVDRVQNASNTVVVFGVFLVAVALLGAALTAIVDLIKSLPEQISRDRMTVVVTLVILYAAASVLGVLFVATGTRRSRGSKWLKGGPGPIE